MRKAGKECGELATTDLTSWAPQAQLPIVLVDLSCHPNDVGKLSKAVLADEGGTSDLGERDRLTIERDEPMRAALFRLADNGFEKRGR